MFRNFHHLADEVAAGTPLTREQAREALACPPEQLLDLISAAGRLRRAAFGTTVKVNYLVNLKSGRCPEDCHYCSQRLGTAAQILKYTWLDHDEAVAQAEQGLRAGASRVCLVASGKGPSERDVDRVGAIVGDLASRNPHAEVCVCLGILKEGQAERLRKAGAHAYNHNINTAESRYEDICTTHEYADRVRTVDAARSAGLQACSGLIVGMGESDDELIDALFALRDMQVTSVPVNFLMPFEGTPLQGTDLLTPEHCLRILALTRLVFPEAEVRMAGGRELHLRSLQPLALHLANSLFLGDYLTSEGQAAKDDLQMIADAGFMVLGADESERPPGRLEVTLRNRGAGTGIAPNA